MAEPEHVLVTCSCGKQFSVAQHLIGREAKCSACGRAFVLAATKTPAGSSKVALCPACGHSMSGGAVLCVECGYSVSTGQRMVTEVTQLRKVPCKKCGQEVAEDIAADNEGRCERCGRRERQRAMTRACHLGGLALCIIGPGILVAAGMWFWSNLSDPMENRMLLILAGGAGSVGLGFLGKGLLLLLNSREIARSMLRDQGPD